MHFDVIDGRVCCGRFGESDGLALGIQVKAVLLSLCNLAFGDAEVVIGHFKLVGLGVGQNLFPQSRPCDALTCLNDYIALPEGRTAVVGSNGDVDVIARSDDGVLFGDGVGLQ